MLAAYIIGSSSLLAWLAARAVDGSPAGGLTDATVWSLRTRIDLLIAFAAICVLGVEVTVQGLETGARLVRLLITQMHLATLLGSIGNRWS